MSRGASFRLNDDAAGRLIDRARPVSFRFDGRRYTGFAGDTLASALLANGVAVVARSPRFGRPRGLLAAGAEEPNGLVACGRGRARGPRLPATLIEIEDGLVARSGAGRLLPGPAALAGRLRGLLPAGSSFKTFLAPGRNGWTLWAPLVRRFAGAAGRARLPAETPDCTTAEAACDVLVVGGGPAGLAAALGAADAGARVILCEALPRLGGLADIGGSSIDGMPQAEWSERQVRLLAARPAVRVLTRTACIDHGDGLALLVERTAPGANAAPVRLWRVAARRVVIATGAVERPLVFRGGDRPGVMLAAAVRACFLRHGVAPGRRGVLFTNNDDAYRTALALHEAGVAEMRIVDTRARPGGRPVMRCMAAGIRMTFASFLTDVETRARGRRITGVHVAPLGLADIASAQERIDCDFVCVSGGWTPTTAGFASDGADGASRTSAAGAAAGIFAPDALVAQARDAGARAARDEAAAPALVPDEAEEEAPARAVMPSEGPRARTGRGNRRFVDLAGDITADDIGIAVREGCRALVQVQGYTRLGAGPDGGATALANADEARRAALGEPAGAGAGIAVAPPLARVPLGVLARAAPADGPEARELPTAAVTGAVCRDRMRAGDWILPRAFRGVGQALEAAVRREADAALHGAALFDLSARGLVEISGADADAFLERACTADVRALPAGACTDGLLLDDRGVPVDVCAVERRAGGGLALVTGIAAGARVAGWLAALHATRWPHLAVTLHERTAATARIAIAGPRAAAILAGLRGDIVREAGQLGDRLREGTVLGARARLARSRWLPGAFEITLDAERAGALWTALLAAGEGGAAPVAAGHEALRRLRLERGLIDPRLVRDPAVTAADLALWRADAARPGAFLGRQALAAPPARGRLHLVGLEGEDGARPLPAGAALVAGTLVTPPVRPAGYVLDAGLSPTLGRAIALALLRDGAERHGETVHAALAHGTAPVRIVAPAFVA